jgi:hypothetical protein
MYSLLIFSLFFISHNSVGSTEELDCQDNSNSLSALSEALVIKCPTEDEVILKNVSQEYQKYFGKLPKKTATIGGLSLQGSQKEIDIALISLGEKPPKDWSKLAKSCSTVFCAFEKNLKSKESAFQLFNIAAKSGYVLTLDQSLNPRNLNQVWSPAEIREMDAAVNKLPKELKQLKHLKKIERMVDGYRIEGHNANVAAFATNYDFMENEAKIVMYDTGLSEKSSGLMAYDSVAWPQEVLVHELCHHHDYNGDYDSYFSSEYYSMNEDKGFSTLSGWKKTLDSHGGDKWVYSTNAQFISDYAKTNPIEDYAETCMNYVLHPNELQRMVPLKYSYMKKNVFNGADFKNSPWNSLELNWPALRSLVADENGCSLSIAKCLEELNFDGQRLNIPLTIKKSGNTISTTYVDGHPFKNIKENQCVKKMRSDRVAQFINFLSSQDDFCQQGGEYGVLKNANKICAKAENLLANMLNEATSIQLFPLISKCQNSTTTQLTCVSELFFKKFPPPIPEEYKKIVKKVIDVRFQNASKKK